MDTQRSVLTELLRLYDWRREVGAVITKEQALRYGQEKKAAWEAARQVLAPNLPNARADEDVEWLRWQAEMYLAGDDKFAYRLRHIADRLLTLSTTEIL